MSAKTTALTVFLCVLAYCVFMSACHSFAARCAQAGYEGAAYERCILRTSEGGPTYEENVGYKP